MRISAVGAIVTALAFFAPTGVEAQDFVIVASGGTASMAGTSSLAGTTVLATPAAVVMPRRRLIDFLRLRGPQIRNGAIFLYNVARVFETRLPQLPNQQQQQGNFNPNAKNVIPSSSDPTLQSLDARLQKIETFLNPHLGTTTTTPGATPANSGTTPGVLNTTGLAETGVKETLDQILAKLNKSQPSALDQAAIQQQVKAEVASALNDSQGAFQKAIKEMQSLRTQFGQATTDLKTELKTELIADFSKELQKQLDARGLGNKPTDVKTEVKVEPKKPAPAATPTGTKLNTSGT